MVSDTENIDVFLGSDSVNPIERELSSFTCRLGQLAGLNIDQSEASFS